MNIFIMKILLFLVIVCMLGGIFLLGKIDPEEENKQIREKKSSVSYGNERR